jgi:predicted MFS family arabinose efflux permease
VLTTYRQALALPGARAFSSSAFVARLPIAMIGLGIVLLISERTGSYALAGVLAATFQVGAAVGGLVTSRWMDQVGQARLLPALAGLHALGLIAFVAAVETDQPVAVQLVAVILAGLSQPAIGSMVRARWAHAATDGEHLRGAFALESIVDELIFSIGPLLTAFLAFQVGLPVPILVGAVLAVAGSLVLAAQRRTQPPASGRRRASHGGERHRSALRSPGIALMAIASLGVGGVFGSYEVSVVAFSQEAGQPGASGIILGLWAIGSMIGGIYFGARRWHVPLPRQVMLLTGLLALVLIPAPFVRTVPLLAVSTFLAGMAVAPALIAIFSLTERLVPAAQLTEGLTWTNSGLALGFSGGTAIAGIVVDALGTSWAFCLPFASAAAACITATAGQSLLSRAAAGRPQPPPAVSWVDDPVPGPGPGAILDDPPTDGTK